jgi:hypothetical protein
VRLHIFALPKVPRDAPTTIRVHFCPELPNMIEEMHMAEDAEVSMPALSPCTPRTVVALSYRRCARTRARLVRLCSPLADRVQRLPPRLCLLCAWHCVRGTVSVSGA